MPVFLANLTFATHIIIADGGSTDRSKEIALGDARVVWYDFPDRVQGKNGGWRNPEGKHMRFLIDKCEEHVTSDEDWLWITEVDAIPSIALQERAVDVLTRMNSEGLHLLKTWLLYISPDGRSHYPTAMQGSGYTAWKKGLATITATTDGDFEGQGNLSLPETGALDLDQKYGRIHLSWQTEEILKAKYDWYQQVHGWNLPHPDTSLGDREPFPNWATWHDPHKVCGMDGYGWEDQQ